MCLNTEIATNAEAQADIAAVLVVVMVDIDFILRLLRKSVPGVTEMGTECAGGVMGQGN